MTPAILAALVVAVIGTAILLIAVASDMPRPAQLVLGVRIFFALGLPSALTGVGSYLLLAPHHEAERIAAGAAAVTGLAALLTHALRALVPARVRRAMLALSRGDGSHDTIALLLDNLPRLRPSVPATAPYRGAYVPLVLEAAGRLIAHASYAEAARLCDELPRAWLTEPQATHRDSTLAIARMRLGELAEARAVLDRAKLPARHADQATLELARAMLLCLERKPAEALLIVGDDRWLDAHTRVPLWLTRAHAHAALGAVAEAREALGRVRALLGEAGLAAALTTYPGEAATLTAPPR